MYPAGNLFIPVGHGQLEAILKEPRQGPSKGVALVLHPHPLGGGTMHNKVVFRAAAALNDAGLTVLRINFRGVGQSTGTHDEGRGELDDVRAGLDYLSSQYPGQRITTLRIFVRRPRGTGSRHPRSSRGVFDRHRYAARKV